MAEAVVFNLADSIIGKSSSLTLPETEPWLNVRDDVDDLRSIASAIKDKLHHAGERSETSNFTAWLKKLEDTLRFARCLLDGLSSEVWRESTSFSISSPSPSMCALIQAVKNRLTSLESEFKIPFMAGTRQQGHVFVHKDEEQSVKDYSFQGRLKVQKDLENMPVDSISIHSQTALSGR
ncbi:hypothetical protein Golax_015582, partial [Gossypium laxum]|nr:hypothetical protein [Gossypium laxum]